MADWTCDWTCERDVDQFFKDRLRHFISLSDAAREISKIRERVLFDVRKDQMAADGLTVWLVDETALGHDPLPLCVGHSAPVAAGPI